MKIGIHKSDSEYSKRWIEYCVLHKVDYKIVNAYDNDIVKQLDDCDVFMWHHHHGDYRDVNFAKQLLFSLQQAGVKVFPDFNTGWHFDDKLGQKYLFEANDIKAAESFAFYDHKSALEWVEKTTFPKIFKLRGGAGSANVKMVKTKSQAIQLINKAFGKGFKAFNHFGLARDKFKLFLRGKASIRAAVRYTLMGLFPRRYTTYLLPDQKGYVYFQEFIPNEGYDIRIEITGDKAIALKRATRKGDFRASGSNSVTYNAPEITKEVIEFAFNVVDKLGMQACALDIVKDIRNGNLYLIETSYCYGVDDDEFDFGYWTRNGILIDNEKFNGIDWIFENLLSDVK